MGSARGDRGSAGGRGGLGVGPGHRPDLILLELHLPDLGGPEVLAQLHADQTTRDVPVVILSAEATMRELGSLLESGACGYLTKPIGYAGCSRSWNEFMGDGA